MAKDKITQKTRDTTKKGFLGIYKNIFLEEGSIPAPNSRC